MHRISYFKPRCVYCITELPTFLISLFLFCYCPCVCSYFCGAREGKNKQNKTKSKKTEGCSTSRDWTFTYDLCGTRVYKKCMYVCAKKKKNSRMYSPSSLFLCLSLFFILFFSLLVALSRCFSFLSFFFFFFFFFEMKESVTKPTKSANSTLLWGRGAGLSNLSHISKASLMF